eukprot:746304-Hanusia_phi.AAC.1
MPDSVMTHTILTVSKLHSIVSPTLPLLYFATSSTPRSRTGKPHVTSFFPFPFLSLASFPANSQHFFLLLLLLLLLLFSCLFHILQFWLSSFFCSLPLSSTHPFPCHSHPTSSLPGHSLNLIGARGYDRPPLPVQRV